MGEPHDDNDYPDDDDDCPNCGGEGWYYDCFDEGACLHPEDGCDQCCWQCDWCNPRKPRVVDHRDNPMSQVLADALAENEAAADEREQNQETTP